MYFIMVYHNSQPLASKGNWKFEILVLKVFSPKQKNKSNTASFYRKNQILSFQESSIMFLQTITFVEISKTKAIQTDLGKFTHILAY